MQRTPVYIICSPRPQVGKTLLARLMAEFQLLQHGAADAFDINLNEPALIDYLPHLTETADITDTRGQMALMDRIVVNDGIVDLGYPSFDGFFRMATEIGFTKEAVRRGVAPFFLFLAGRDRTSQNAYAMLRDAFPQATLVPVNNEYVLHGDVPETLLHTRMLTLRLLPAFLKSILDRTAFSFGHYLRGPNDPSAELHQWIRGNFTAFHDMETSLLQQEPRLHRR
jgi:hypothetical protein